MANAKSNTLEGLLESNPSLAERARKRAGLAEIASLLLQLRQEKALTQRELARRAGLAKSMISEIENAANEGMTLRTLVSIARGAGASVQIGFKLDAEHAGSVTTTLDCAAGPSDGVRAPLRIVSTERSGPGLAA